MRLTRFLLFMAFEIANLIAKYEADTSGFDRGTERVRKSLDGVVSRAGAASNAVKGFSGAAKGAASGLGGFANGLTAAVLKANLLERAFSFVTSSVVDGASAVLDYSAKLEQTKIGFETLMGGAAQASAHIKELQTLSTSSGLDFPALTKMSQRLQGAGVDAKRIIPLIRDIGATAAATGDLSASRLEGIGTAFSQIASKGRVSAEEMEQLAERGIPAWRMLSEAIGETLAVTRKMAEDGKINSEQLFAAFQKFSQANFGEALNQQANTFSGAWGRITNLIQIGSQEAFAPLYERISGLAKETATRIDAQKGDFGRIGGEIGSAMGQATGITFGAAIQDIAKMMGPVPQSSKTGRFLTEFVKGTATGLFSKGGKQDLEDEPLQLLSHRLSEINTKVKSMPSLADKLKIPAVTQDIKALFSIYSDLVSQVRFFGDETEVAATKQALLHAGFTNLNSGMARSAIVMAEHLDQLKKSAEAAKDYKSGLKSAQDELLNIGRTGFSFKTDDLSQFDDWVRRIGGSFSELKGQIEIVRDTLNLKIAVESLNRYADQLVDAAQFQKELRLSVDRTIRGLETDRTIRGFETEDISPMTAQLREFAESLLAVKNVTITAEAKDVLGISMFPTDFAQQVQSYVAGIRLAGEETALTGTRVQPFRNYLEGLGTIMLEGGNAVRLFNDKTLDELVKKFVALDVATQKSVVNEKLKELGEILKSIRIGTLTPLEQLQKLFTDPAMTEAIKQRATALNMTADALKSMMTHAISPVGMAESNITKELADDYQEIANLKERIARFSNFQALEVEKAQLLEIVNLRQAETQKIIDGNFSFRDRLQLMAAQTASWATSLKDSLAGAIGQISGVFTGAIANWDETVQGFFKNIARGFADMAQQIIDELLRIAVMQAVMAIVGAFTGGGGGGSIFGKLFGGGKGMMTRGGGGIAEGGLIKGPGTGTSDSIFARLSNGEFVMRAKAVKFFGANLLGSMNSLQPAFADGGMASRDMFRPSFQSTANQTAPTGNMQPVMNITQNFHSQKDGTFSKQSAEQAGRTAIATMNRYSQKTN